MSEIPVPFQTDDKSAVVAQQVMHRIGENHLRPNPAVYAVLFNFYAQTHPDITYALDILERENKPLTTSYCEQLFATYLSTKSEKALLDETTRKVQATMEEISNLIRGAGIAHKEYNKSLQEQSTNLSSATELTDIKKMVAVLIEDTSRMVEENHKLENKLENSSHEITQMRQDMQTLKHEAQTDALTGMPNRKAFDSHLKAKASEALDKNRPLSLIMIDIDHFKMFNDTYGHQVGDQVLRLVAKTLQEGLKGTEFLARFGGEEFSVIAPTLKLREAEKLADRLRERIAAKDIINQSKNEKLGRLSVSLGVAQLQSGEALAQLIERADRGLYRAKAAGRNTVIAIEFDPKLHSVQSDIVIDANH
jgi:diguanylate cyclase